MDAPDFTTSDIQKLFADKLIVVIGDSVQRSVYKDLVCLLKDDKLLTLKELKDKGEESFQGDTLLDGGIKTGLHNGTDYKEVRKFTHGNTVIMFYFVTRCYNEYMQSILNEFKLDPPQVIIMNSCLWDLHRYGKAGRQEFIENIQELLKAIDLAVPYDDLLFIWNATLPVRKRVNAGFLPAGVEETLPAKDIRDANLYVSDQLRHYGQRFIFLDLHNVFYRHLDRRVRDGVHWNDFAHRHITCLLLAEISQRWNFEVPTSKRPMPPMPSVLSEIPHFNFPRPRGAVPFGTRPPLPAGVPNGPAFPRLRIPLPPPAVRFGLNTTFPRFSRKRKFEEESSFARSYKTPRKSM